MKKIIANFTAILIATIILLFATISYANEPTHEHNYVLTESVTSTCIAYGYNNYSCECGENYTEDIKTFASHKPTTIGVKKSTLSTNGYTGDTVCSVCNEVLSKGTTIQKIKTVAFSSNSYIYNGKTHKPTVTVTDNKGNKLTNKTDYTVKYSNANSKNAGKYSVTISFTGKYSGSKTLNYYIFKVQQDYTTFTYNGKIKKPTIKVNYGKNKYLSTKKYTVTYSNKKSKNIGTYNASVKFKNGYKGSKKLSYKIVPKNTTIKSFSTTINSVKCTVNKAKNISGYKIRYSTNKNFTSNVKTTTIASKKGYKTLSNLKSGTTYYFQVKTYKTVKNKYYYSKRWSATKSVKTKVPDEPTTPKITSCTSYNNTITVKWKQSKYANGYEVICYRGKDDKIIKKLNIKNTSTTSAKFTGLEYKTEYYISVEAYHKVHGIIYSKFDGTTISTAKKNAKYVTWIDKKNKICVDTLYSWQTVENGYIDTITTYNNEKVSFMKSECDKITNQIKKKLPKNADKYDKIYAINQYIVNNITYDLEYHSYKKYPNNTAIYNAYKYKRTTCGGYAHMFSDLCKKFGITAYYVEGGSPKGYHAWNIIVINGYAYQIEPQDNLCLNTVHGNYNDKSTWRKNWILEVDKEYYSYWNYYKSPNLYVSDNFDELNNCENISYHIMSKGNSNYKIYVDNPEIWKAKNKLDKAVKKNNISESIYYQINIKNFYTQNGKLDNKLVDYEVEACNRGFMFFPEDFINDDGDFDHYKVKKLINRVDDCKKQGYKTFEGRDTHYGTAYIFTNSKNEEKWIYCSTLD